MIDFVRAHTFHGRKGAVENAFRYSVDYVLFEPEQDLQRQGLMARNAAGVMSLHDSDHGGPPKQGRGAIWAREVFEAHDIAFEGPLKLLTQPRLFGHVFNPVSFWLAYGAGGGLRAVIAEVSNTFGDRHSYLCAKPDGSDITPEDRVTAAKIFHVSPFQPIEGGYTFRFDIRSDRVGVWIDLDHAQGGVIATLVGGRAPLRRRDVLYSALRRPFGARRVLGLIHWQALKLWWKGAGYRNRPEPPKAEVSGAPTRQRHAS
ncbi:DUF1365 domain-containing protein [Sagittula sp. SSi028]|uniref:DUF1365 domain-containing protein n=1 Tax=Sagittula sp. SSi028 TaxID=3400636 RepID=UPI003AF9B8C4